MTKTQTTPETVSHDLDSLDPASIRFQDAIALRAIGDAAAALDAAKVALDEAVTAANARGVSWSAIGGMLGITRQAARQRFGNG